MTFKIEKGVPIPPAITRSGSNVELLRAMEVGDSVFFGPDVAKAATRFYRVAKRVGVAIVIRKDGDGMRMWRTTAPIESLGTPVAAKPYDPVAAAKKGNAETRAIRKASPDGMTPSERAMAKASAATAKTNGKKGKTTEQKAKDAAKAKQRRAAAKSHASA